VDGAIVGNRARVSGELLEAGAGGKSGKRHDTSSGGSDPGRDGLWQTRARLSPPNGLADDVGRPAGNFICIHRIFPGEGIEKGYSTLDTYKHGASPTDKDRHLYQTGHDLILKVVGSEDYAVRAGAQRNLRHAPPGFRSIVGRNELGVQNVHRHLAEATGMPLQGMSTA
jgi:hypothetical protein